jgi:hypothetical protein
MNDNVKIFIDYYMAFVISHVISTRDAHISQGLIWVEGWYGMWYEKWHIITYLSYTSMRLSSYLWELIIFRNSIAWFGIWCNNVIIYLRFYYVFRDIILIQLHFLYNNTRWFNIWFIKECHHSLHNEHFPCFLRNPFWQ